jgi:ketosteroid isomerase-like protein
MNSPPKMTLERLRAFDAAWGNKDLDALMDFMTDDCEYHASVGPDPGSSFIGKEAVRQGFKMMLEHDSAGEPRSGAAFIHEDQGVAEWSYVTTDALGRTREVRGCDLFKFTGD